MENSHAEEVVERLLEHVTTIDAKRIGFQPHSIVWVTPSAKLSSQFVSSVTPLLLLERDFVKSKTVALINCTDGGCSGEMEEVCGKLGGLGAGGTTRLSECAGGDTDGDVDDDVADVFLVAAHFDGGAAGAEVCGGAALEGEAGEADEMAGGEGGNVGEKWSGSEKAVEAGVGVGVSLSGGKLGGGKLSGFVFGLARGRRESGTGAGGEVGVAGGSGEDFERHGGAKGGHCGSEV